MMDQSPTRSSHNNGIVKIKNDPDTQLATEKGDWVSLVNTLRADARQKGMA